MGGLKPPEFTCIINGFSRSIILNYVEGVKLFRFFTEPLNWVTRKTFRIIFKRYTKKSRKLVEQTLNRENIEVFLDSTSSKKKIGVVRDLDYFQWRFLESPDVQSYRILKMTTRGAAIVKIRYDVIKTGQLDILLIIPGLTVDEMTDLIGSITIWAEQKGYSSVRYGVSSSKMSKKIGRNLYSRVRKPIFAFFSDNVQLSKNKDILTCDWQLADSDFEFT